MILRMMIEAYKTFGKRMSWSVDGDNRFVLSVNLTDDEAEMLRDAQRMVS